jgi:hypothetical protein
MNKKDIKSYNSENPAANMFLNTVEKTVQDSTDVPATYLKPYNPDDLYQKNQDYTIYERMRNDDQCYAAIQLKRDIIVGNGWELIPMDEGQEDVVDDITMKLERDPDYPFDDYLGELVESGCSFGFAIGEKLFAKKDDGSATLKSIKIRHPNTWE